MSPNPASSSAAFSSRPNCGCPPLPSTSPAKNAPGVLYLGGLRLQEGRGYDDLAAGYDAAGLEHPLDLGQCRLRVGNVHQDGVTVGRVEGVVIEGQLRGAAHVKGHVVMAAGGRGGASQFNLGFFHVYAVELARSDALGEADGDGAGATAEVEQL